MQKKLLIVSSFKKVGVIFESCVCICFHSYAYTHKKVLQDMKFDKIQLCLEVVEFVERRIGKVSASNHDGITITRLSLLLEMTRKLDKRYETRVLIKQTKAAQDGDPRENENKADSAITLAFSQEALFSL